MRLCSVAAATSDLDIEAVGVGAYYAGLHSYFTHLQMTVDMAAEDRINIFQSALLDHVTGAATVFFRGLKEKNYIAGEFGRLKKGAGP